MFVVIKPSAPEEDIFEIVGLKDKHMEEVGADAFLAS